MRVEIRWARRRAVVSSVVSQHDSRPRFEVYVDQNLRCAKRFRTLSTALRGASALIGCDAGVRDGPDLMFALRRAGADIHWDN